MIKLIDEIERMKKENPNLKVKDIPNMKVSYEFLEQEHNELLEKMREILDFEINWKKIRQYLEEAKII